MPLRTQFETEAEWLNHLRLWFAGQALSICDEPDWATQDIARWAYAIADAMLEACK